MERVYVESTMTLLPTAVYILDRVMLYVVEDPVLGQSTTTV